MDYPLISVIVPIYNVAPYLRKCLNSLNNQTLRQIQIICIDDGSTDGSDKIVDEYSNIRDIWPQFKIVHTNNLGLSAARNRGIIEALADYIMFVDSDDWVVPQFCEIPYNIAINNGSDMVIFDYYITNEKGKIKRAYKCGCNDGIIDFECAIDIGKSAAWRRLYKRSLFNSVQYPEGHVYEDSATTHKLVYKSKNIYYINKNLYFYRYRKGSICHLLSNEKDRLNMNINRYYDLIRYGYPSQKAFEQLCGVALRCCGRIDHIESKVYQDAYNILNQVVGIPKGLSFKEKIMMVFWRFNSNLYRIIYRTLVVFII